MPNARRNQEPLPREAFPHRSPLAFSAAVPSLLVQATTPQALLQELCEAAVAQGGFVTAFIASPNANVGWLTVEAGAGFQAARLRDIRFLAKEVPGDPWGWMARTWRLGTASGPQSAAAWPVLSQHAPDSCGMALAVRRKHAAASVLVLWAHRPEDVPPATIQHLQDTAHLLGLTLDKLHLESERAASTQEVRQAELRYRAILDTIEDAYYEVDLRGKPVYFNAAFSRMLGHDPAEPVTSDHRRRQTPEMAARVFKAFNEVYLTGVSRRNEEWEYIHREGHRLQVEGSVQLVRDAQGQPVGFRGMLRDVTDRRRIEATLRESEARFRALASLSADWYWEQDEAHRLVRLQNRHAHTDGLQRSFLGRPVWESPLTVCSRHGWDRFRAGLEQHEPFRGVVMEGHLPNGRPYRLAVSGEPIIDEAGAFRGYRGVARDVTARERVALPQ